MSRTLLAGSISFASVSFGVSSCLNSYNTYSNLQSRASALNASLNPAIQSANNVTEHKHHGSQELEGRGSQESAGHEPQESAGHGLAPIQSQPHALASTSTLKAENDRLVQYLNGFLQNHKKTLPADDAMRVQMLSEAFHHKFVPWLRDTLRERPAIADLAYCKAHCEEPTFREGYQHGVSMSLLVLGSGIRQYHDAGMTEEEKDSVRYLYRVEHVDFGLEKEHAEMLSPHLGVKGWRPLPLSGSEAVNGLMA